MSLESTIRMMAEKKVVKEDGHTDVASAKRQCKTAMEDAQAIIGVLDGMNDEDALPTWWTNKLAIAANSMNKLNDYLSNPTEQKEEVELDESVQETEMYDLDNLIEEALDEEVKYPHMMYDPETGKGVEAKTPEDHDKLAKKGYTHEKPELDEYNEKSVDKEIEKSGIKKGSKEAKLIHRLLKGRRGSKKEEVELDEAPKMKYALVGKDMKIYSMGSDERDLRLDRRSLEKRFKDVAPLKMARLKTAQKIGDTVDKSQLKEETVNEHTHYKMEPFGVSRSLVDSVRSVLAGKPQEEALDKVDPKAVKKKFDDRKDKDIDNDGDVDDSDEYLHKRRQAISKAVKGEEKDDKKKDKKDEKNGKKEPIEIDPEIKEDTVKEQEMTDAQMKRREEIVKELKKKEDEFKDRYGDRWKEVMYATATKMAMKEAKK